jgi:mRNA-degrading endonuclease RelE of RelBE toxin-antitoxin system
LRIDLSPAFRQAVRALPKARRSEIGRAIKIVRDTFGNPHPHAGIGIRRLRDSVFECRVGLKTRLVFEAEHRTLTFTAFGDHDEVRKLMKKL